jgi:hypothetical protein
VLRIFAGDFVPGEISGVKITQVQWLLIAVLMITPIMMLFLSLILPYPAVRWVNIAAAAGWFLFNLAGLPTYPSLFDKFLNVFGLAINAITIWFAWSWI